MASDIFAKIGDIKGRIRRRQAQGRNRGAVVLLGRHQWTRPLSAGGGAGAGKATFQDLSIVHTIDKASPAAAEGVRDGSAPEGSHHHPSQGGQGPAGVPRRQDERRHHHRRRAWRLRRRASSETVSLVFAKVDFEYRPQKIDGHARCRNSFQVRHQGQQRAG